MFSMLGLLQKVSFSSFASLADLEVAQWGIAEKAPATHFPNSPWNWAPGILSFLPHPTIPSPSLVVINMRKVAVRAPPNASGTGEGARPGGQTPRQQGVTRGENSKTGGVTRRWLILSLATPVKVNSHRCLFATGRDKFCVQQLYLLY